MANITKLIEQLEAVGVDVTMTHSVLTAWNIFDTIENWAEYLEYEAANDGFDEGHGFGYEEGLNEGYDDGKAEGFDEGYEAGRKDGHDKGYDKGVEQGDPCDPILPPTTTKTKGGTIMTKLEELKVAAYAAEADYAAKDAAADAYDAAYYAYAAAYYASNAAYYASNAAYYTRDAHDARDAADAAYAAAYAAKDAAYADYKIELDRVGETL